MAQFDANIKLLVQAQDAYREIAKLEKKLDKLSDKNTVRQIKGAVSQSRSEVNAAEKKLSNQLRLNAALERQENLLKGLKRAGVSGGRSDRVDELIKVGKSFKNNLRIQNAVNAGLEKELETLREINRTDRAQNATSAKLTTNIKQRLNALKAVGATQAEITKIEKKRDEVIAKNSRKQTDLARESFAQLDRQLSTLERKYSTFLGKPGRQIASPIRGSKTTVGSPAYLEEQAKQLNKQENLINKTLDDQRKLREANARAAERALKASQKGYASSPIRGSKTMPDSPLYREASLKAEREEIRKNAALMDRVDKAERDRERRRLKAVKDRAKEERDAARKAEKLAKKRDNRLRRGTKRFGAGAVGGGFPLLFGGGPGGVIGGLLGGLLGGDEFGFETSLALSAVGTQLDKVGESARILAQNLNDPSNLLEELSNQGFKVSRNVSANVKALEDLGRVADATALAQQELIKTLGNRGVAAIVNFDKAADKLQDSLARLSTTVFTELEPAISTFIKGINLLVDSLLGDKVQRDFANLRPQEFQAITTQAATEISQRGDFGQNSTQDRLRYNARINELIKERMATIKETVAIEVSSSAQLEQKNNRLEASAKRIKEIRKQELDFIKQMYQLEIRRADIEASRLESTVRLLALQRARNQELIDARARGVTAKREANATITQNLLEAIKRGGFSSGLNKNVIDGLFDRLNELDVERINAEAQELAETLTRAGYSTESIILLTDRYKKVLGEAAESANELNRRLFRTDEQVLQDKIDVFEAQAKVLSAGTTEAERQARLELGLLQLRQTNLELTEEQFKKLADAYTKLFNLQNKAEDSFTKLLNNVGTTLKDAMETALVDTLAAAIQGADDLDKKLQQTASSLLTTIGKMLVNFGINSLAGDDGVGFFSFLKGGLKADGGPVSASQPYIVGERGPELFIPGRAGSVVTNEDTRAALGRYGGSVGAGGGSRTIRFESQVINNVEYVTKDEAVEMSRAAADDGARRGASAGHSRTMTTLQQSRSSRSRLGMR